MDKPGAPASTKKTPDFAATRIKSATSASRTKSFSPVNLPLEGASFESAKSQVAAVSSKARVERASPRQIGARYLVFCASLATASITPPARATVDQKGP